MKKRGKINGVIGEELSNALRYAMAHPPGTPGRKRKSKKDRVR